MDSDHIRHQPQHRGSAGKAILAGVGVAVAGSAVWGLAAYLVRYQFSLLAVVIGLTVGTVMAWVRPGDRSLAVPGAIISVAGCALGSLAAEVLIALSHNIPVTVLLGDFGPIVRAYPSTVGWLGFLFWALAACVGFRVLAGAGGWWRSRETSVQEMVTAGTDVTGPADTDTS